MKRKTLTLVLCLLATFALASIGFASWIISNPADVNVVEQGSFTVYDATDSTAKVSVNFANDKKKIIFGKPTADEITNANFTTPWLTLGTMDVENLAVSITVSESNADYVGTLEVYLYVDSATYQKLEKAKTDGLINYEASQFTTLTINENTYYGVKVEVSQSDDKTQSKTLNLNFSWGTTFGGINPYLHYNKSSYSANAVTALDGLLPLNDLKFNILVKEKAA